MEKFLITVLAFIAATAADPGILPYYNTYNYYTAYPYPVSGTYLAELTAPVPAVAPVAPVAPVPSAPLASLVYQTYPGLNIPPSPIVEAFSPANTFPGWGFPYPVYPATR